MLGRGCNDIVSGDIKPKAGTERHRRDGRVHRCL